MAAPSASIVNFSSPLRAPKPPPDRRDKTVYCHYGLSDDEMAEWRSILTNAWLGDEGIFNYPDVYKTLLAVGVSSVSTTVYDIQEKIKLDTYYTLNKNKPRMEVLQDKAAAIGASLAEKVAAVGTTPIRVVRAFRRQVVSGVRLLVSGPEMHTIRDENNPNAVTDSDDYTTRYVNLLMKVVYQNACVGTPTDIRIRMEKLYVAVRGKTQFNASASVDPKLFSAVARLNGAWKYKHMELLRKDASIDTNKRWVDILAEQASSTVWGEPGIKAGRIRKQTTNCHTTRRHFRNLVDQYRFVMQANSQPSTVAWMKYAWIYLTMERVSCWRDILKLEGSSIPADVKAAQGNAQDARPPVTDMLKKHILIMMKLFIPPWTRAVPIQKSDLTALHTGLLEIAARVSSDLESAADGNPTELLDAARVYNTALFKTLVECISSIDMELDVDMASGIMVDNLDENALYYFAKPSPPPVPVEAYLVTSLNTLLLTNKEFFRPDDTTGDMITDQDFMNLVNASSAMYETAYALCRQLSQAFDSLSNRIDIACPRNHARILINDYTRYPKLVSVLGADMQQIHNLYTTTDVNSDRQRAVFAMNCHRILKRAPWEGQVTKTQFLQLYNDAVEYYIDANGYSGSPKRVCNETINDMRDVLAQFYLPNESNVHASIIALHVSCTRWRDYALQTLDSRLKTWTSAPGISSPHIRIYRRMIWADASLVAMSTFGPRENAATEIMLPITPGHATNVYVDIRTAVLEVEQLAYDHNVRVASETIVCNRLVELASRLEPSTTYAAIAQEMVKVVSREAATVTQISLEHVTPLSLSIPQVGIQEQPQMTMEFTPLQRPASTAASFAPPNGPTSTPGLGMPVSGFPSASGLSQQPIISALSQQSIISALSQQSTISGLSQQSTISGLPQQSTISGLPQQQPQRVRFADELSGSAAGTPYTIAGTPINSVETISTSSGTFSSDGSNWSSNGSTGSMYNVQNGSTPGSIYSLDTPGQFSASPGTPFFEPALTGSTASNTGFNALFSGSVDSTPQSAFTGFTPEGGQRQPTFTPPQQQPSPNYQEAFAAWHRQQQSPGGQPQESPYGNPHSQSSSQYGGHGSPPFQPGGYNPALGMSQSQSGESVQSTGVPVEQPQPFDGQQQGFPPHIESVFSQQSNGALGFTPDGQQGFTLPPESISAGQQGVAPAPESISAGQQGSTLPPESISAGQQGSTLPPESISADTIDFAAVGGFLGAGDFTELDSFIGNSGATHANPDGVIESLSETNWMFDTPADTTASGQMNTQQYTEQAESENARIAADAERHRQEEKAQRNINHPDSDTSGTGDVHLDGEPRFLPVSEQQQQQQPPPQQSVPDPQQQPQPQHNLHDARFERYRIFVEEINRRYQYTHPWVPALLCATEVNRISREAAKINMDALLAVNARYQNSTGNDWLCTTPASENTYGDFYGFVAETPGARRKSSTQWDRYVNWFTSEDPKSGRSYWSLILGWVADINAIPGCEDLHLQEIPANLQPKKGVLVNGDTTFFGSADGGDAAGTTPAKESQGNGTISDTVTSRTSTNEPRRSSRRSTSNANGPENSTPTAQSAGATPSDRSGLNMFDPNVEGPDDFTDPNFHLAGTLAKDVFNPSKSLSLVWTLPVSAPVAVTLISVQLPASATPDQLRLAYFGAMSQMWKVSRWAAQWIQIPIDATSVHSLSDLETRFNTIKDRLPQENVDDFTTICDLVTQLPLMTFWIKQEQGLLHMKKVIKSPELGYKPSGEVNGGGHQHKINTPTRENVIKYYTDRAGRLRTAMDALQPKLCEIFGV